jgi:hypothetical protein
MASPDIGTILDSVLKWVQQWGVIPAFILSIASIILAIEKLATTIFLGLSYV